MSNNAVRKIEILDTFDIFLSEIYSVKSNLNKSTVLTKVVTKTEAKKCKKLIWKSITIVAEISYGILGMNIENMIPKWYELMTNIAIKQVSMTLKSNGVCKPGAFVLR